MDATETKRMTTGNDEITNDTNNCNAIGDNSVIMMFTSELVQHAASPELRLPANFVGVQSVRQDFCKSLASEEQISKLKTENDVKFCIIDANGNERRMTKAEKKAKKKEMADAKKEAKKEANRKRNLDQISKAADKGDTNGVATNHQELSTYHQLPLDQMTMEQELSEGKRGRMPPVILSPPMAMRFIHDGRYDGGAILAYSHIISQQWANILKQKCVLPAEALREKEDLRPMAYRLQPEPWQRLRPSLDESPLVTNSRLGIAIKTEQTRDKNNPKPRDWASLECRPRLISSEKPLQHDDILSIVFEYIHRETPYYVSCGAKFGSDFLIYDGPRDQRHAFAGLRVLSPYTNPMIQDDTVELPLPTAYSLTGFVRCLNTAGKLALLATVTQVIEESTIRYNVVFVDVALEKVLDVHKKKNRSNKKKKLQKRRDVTQTLSKK